MQNLTLDEETILALPALTEISQTQSLGEYFGKKVSSLKNIKQKNIENDILTKAMVTEIARLYGEEIAQQAHNQLTTLPIIETGTHLGAMKDYDNLQKDDVRASLHQNTIISASLLKSAGGNIHIGSYGSNVSLNHSFSGGYFQIGDELFQTAPTKRINSNLLYNAPAISEDYFNPNVLIVAKLSGLRDILKESEAPQEKALLKCATELLAPIEKSKTNFASFEKNYEKLNSGKKILINKALTQLNSKQKEKTGVSFDEMDEQYAKLEKVFSRKELSLSDQMALIQSQELNSITKPADITHVSIDALKVVKTFFIEALKNEDSLWAQIFNNKEMASKFHQEFVGVRSSWKENESPFDFLRTDKGYTQTNPLPYGATDVDAKSLAKLLEEDKIVPSTALIVMAHQSADMLIHGGFFQSTYAKKIQDKFVDFLDKNQFTKYADNIREIPSDVMLLSLSVAQKNGRPMKISEISRLPDDKKQMLIDNIPNHSSSLAVKKGLPYVSQYLEKTSPGYIASESKLNRAKKIRAQKIITIQNLMAQGRVRGVSASAR